MWPPSTGYKHRTLVLCHRYESESQKSQILVTNKKSLTGKRGFGALVFAERMLIRHSPHVITKSTRVLKKVQCTLIQALRFCTGRTAHRGSRGIALPFLDHGSEGVRGQRHTPEALYPQGRLGTHFTGGWVGPRGIRSPDRPARSQSLYRLRYPAHEMLVIVYKTTRWHTSRITLNILPHRW